MSAEILAIIVVGIVILAGAALLGSLARQAWQEWRQQRRRARGERAQREADEHAYDLISKGKGGAI